MEKKVKSVLDWSGAPPDGDLPSDYAIVRPPVKGFTNGIILNPNIHGKVVHYFKGRTGPCNGPQCEACAAKIRKGWRSWHLFYGAKSKQTVILELTAGGTVPLVKARSQYTDLKGLHISVGRRPERSNGRHVCHVLKMEDDKRWLPRAPEIIPIMERIWGTSALGEEKEANAKEIETLAGQIAIVRDRGLNVLNGQSSFLQHD